MLRRILAIFVLAVALATFLFLKPWQFEKIPPPRFFDRLPDADFIGKSDVLEFSRALSSTMYYYKIPIREFLSHDFILAQGKTHGIDLQKPIFFFGDIEAWGIDDFGIMTILSDSSKVQNGFAKLSQVLEMKDTTIFNTRVSKNEEYNFYISYGADWLLAYQGTNFKKRLNGIIAAKRNEIPPKWREFLNTTEYNNTNAVAYFEFKDLKEIGVHSTSISIHNDSSSLYLNTAVHQMDTLQLSLRENGPSYEAQEFTKYLVNLHCNADKLQLNNSDPLFVLGNKYMKRISFPTESLLKAWTGNISYRQGGIHEVDERYIESILDENFNVQEVVKTKKVKVPSFSLYLSMNEHCDAFLNKLTAKGILTEEHNRYRLLYSPPLNMNKTDTSLVFHTGKYIPNINTSTINEVVWTHDYTPYTFIIDSTKVKSIYSTIRIPLERIIKHKLPNSE